MLKVIANLAEGKWEVNAFLFLGLYVILVTAQHFSASQISAPQCPRAALALPACLTQKKPPSSAPWELGVVLATF